MIKISGAVPVLRVADVQRTLDWYGEMLGFEPHTFPQDPPFEFAVLSFASTRIMARQMPGYRRDPRLKGWDVYLSIEGGRLRELYEDLRERVTILRPLQRMPYGDTEFDIRDPDGHVLCLGELLADTSGIPDAKE